MNRRKRLYKKTLPLHLLVAGKKVLVVGGGKVAEHKLVQLLEANMRVKVVAPDITSAISAYAQQCDVECCLRGFLEEDLQGIDLVIAATNDAALNRHILTLAHQQRILVGSVDDAWSEGDFITPATLRRGVLTVSVATGGLSCRLSRMVKESLTSQITAMSEMDLMVLGISHRTMELSQREAFMLSADKLQQAEQRIRLLSGVQEFMILLTCNRVEFVGFAHRTAELEALLKMCLNFQTLQEGQYYVHSGKAAFEHLAFTLAGLYSQTPGEKHIVAQVKEALAEAKSRQLCGHLLTDGINSALHVSRQIRQYLFPLFHTYEIESLAIAYLKEVLPNLSQTRIAVIGTGMVGAQLVEELKPLGCRIVWGWHRNQPNLETQTNQLELRQLTQLVDSLGEFEAVICATSAEGYVLTSEMKKQFSSCYLLDLCNPRNIDPELKSEQVKVVDLDDLKYWFRRELVDIETMYETCRDIVAENIEYYDKLLIDFRSMAVDFLME